MESEALLTTQIGILLLLLVACLGAIAFKRLHFPYTVGLVITGLGLGLLAQNAHALASLRSLELSHELILLVFVPPLVFASAINIDLRLLIRSLLPTLTLAVPGLLLSTAIVGLVLSQVTALTLSQALLFGALISATDPVAVMALFQELGVPKTLMILVEGESLFNDATAIVTFSIVLSTINSGIFNAFTLTQGVINFLMSFFGGTLIGLLVGIIFCYVMVWARQNALVQGTLSAIAAYTAFILADEILHLSGVMAVIGAGIVVGWYKSIGLKPQVRGFLSEFWEYSDFLANSLIFLLVGLTTAGFIFRLSETEPILSDLLWAIATVLLARAIVVFGLTSLVNLVRHSSPINWQFQLVSFWGGLRGAVGLALPLSLPPEFPNRDLILALTLGIALFTILVSGTTMAKLIHSLKLDQPSVLDRIQTSQAKVVAKRQGLAQVEQLSQMESVSRSTIENLRQDYQQALQEAEETLTHLWQQPNLNPRLFRQLIWLEAIAIEQKTYHNLYDDGLISGTVFEHLNLTMNLKRDAVKGKTIPPNIPTTSPMEARLENVLAGLVGRILPERRLVEHQNHKIADEYEKNMAIAYAGARVAHEIREIAQESDLTSEITNECAQAYEAMSQDAGQALEAQAARSPELTKTLQAQVAYRFARLAEEEALKRLTNEDVISEQVAAKAY
jgi:monovalent cation:H+ antiporter, CPA1 family